MTSEAEVSNFSCQVWKTFQDISFCNFRKFWNIKREKKTETGR